MPNQCNMPQLIDCEEHTGPGPRGNECPICWDIIEEHVPSVTHVNCGNIFCQDCIYKRVVEQESGELARCPMDRGVIGVGEHEEEEDEEEDEDDIPQLYMDRGRLTWRGEENTVDYLDEPFTVSLASRTLHLDLAPFVSAIRQSYGIEDDHSANASSGVPFFVLSEVW